MELREIRERWSNNYVSRWRTLWPASASRICAMLLMSIMPDPTPMKKEMKRSQNCGVDIASLTEYTLMSAAWSDCTEPAERCVCVWR